MATDTAELTTRTPPAPCVRELTPEIRAIAAIDQLTLHTSDA